MANLILPRHYAASIEGVPVRYVATHKKDVPQHLRAGVDAPKRALIQARIDIDDNRTVSLLTRLQTVHDAFSIWEWQRLLKSNASEFGLSASCLRRTGLAHPFAAVSSLPNEPRMGR
jgi:hypothetical protein